MDHGLIKDRILAIEERVDEFLGAGVCLTGPTIFICDVVGQKRRGEGDTVLWWIAFKNSAVAGQGEVDNW